MASAGPAPTPRFGGGRAGPAGLSQHGTLQGGSITEITTDLDTPLTVRQHVRAAIRWALPLDPAWRAVGFFFAGLCVVYTLLASSITWSLTPLTDLLWVAELYLGILILWKTFFTLAILGLWVCGGRRQSLKAAWEDVARDLCVEPYFPLIQRELRLREKRQASCDYLVEHGGYSREEAKRLARLYIYH